MPLPGFTLLCSTLLAPSLIAAEAMGRIQIGSTERDFQDQVWTREEGLPGTSIQSLNQTKDGYLWMGTRSGVVRFDGVTFTSFNHANTSAIKSDNCGPILEDRDGALWIGTADGLILHEGRKFKRFSVADSPVQEPISAMALAPDGGLWLGTGRLCHFKEGRVSEVPWKAAGWVRSMIYDRTGAFWFIKDYGLFRGDPNRGQPAGPFLVAPGMLATLAIHAQESGDLWGVCSDNVPPQRGWVWRYREGRFDLALKDERVLNDGRNQTLFSDRKGDLWFLAGKHGICRIRQGEFTLYPIRWGIPEDIVLCICEDREGQLWLGTESGRLHRLRTKSVQALSRTDGLADNQAFAILETGDGSMWIGTDGGVSRISPNQGAFDAGSESRIENITVQNGLARKDVRALAETPDGTLWIGTGNGLDSLAHSKFAHRRFPAPGVRPDPDGIAWNKVRALLAAKDGSLWVSVSKGLHHLQEDRDTYVGPIPHASTGELEIRAILETRNRHLWLGTAGSGLCRFSATEPLGAAPPSPTSEEAASAILKRLPDSILLTAKDGLSSDYIWALYEGRDGCLWVGTDRGLNRLREGPAGHFEIFSFTTRHGLPESSIHCILEDDFENLWFSTDQGVYCATLKELNAAAGRSAQIRAVLFDENDGMPTAKTNGEKSQPAGCKARDGRLWFPTEQGVAIIDSRVVKDVNVPPPAVIEQVIADDETVMGDFALAKLGDTPRLRLPPGRARSMEFRFTGNSFIASERIQFRYRLEGYDKGWHEAGVRRAAYYSNLKPGEYCFRVMARNHHGFWSEAPAAFAFALAPHYWQTEWFYAGCAVAAGLLVWSGHRWRMKLQKLRQDLEFAAQRERLAANLHDEVGSNLTQMRRLLDLARHESAAIQGLNANLQQMEGSIIAATRTMSEVIWAANPAQDHLQALAAFISNYAAEFLDPFGIRLRQDIPASLPRYPIPAEERHEIFLIVKEALNNIAKHGHASEVWLRVSLNADGFSIMLEDNGRGFLPDDVRPLANGLVNMEKRAAAVGAEFRLDSSPGNGARICLRFRRK